MQQIIQTMMNGHVVEVVTVSGWEALVAQNSVILAERGQSMTERLSDGSMSVRVFMPNVDGLPLPPTDNRAVGFLQYIVQQPNIIGNASITAPTGFVWDGYDAAYYTLDSGGELVTMLLAVHVHTDEWLVFNINIPRDRRNQLHAMLPDVLHHIQINDNALAGSGLLSLPNPLTFPDTQIEIAIESTP